MGFGTMANFETKFGIVFLATISIIAAECPASEDGISNQTELAVIAIGRSIDWKIPANLHVNVSNGEIVRAVDLKDRIRIVGKKRGEAEIRAGTRVLAVHVMDDDSANLYRRLRETIETRRGLELSIRDNRITVTGRLLRLDDWFTLASITEGTGAKFDFRASLTPDLEAAARARFKIVLRQAHLPEVALQLQPAATVTAPIEPADLKTRLERALGPYGFHVESSSAALSLEPMVRVRLLVAEVRKAMKRQLGITWPGAIPAHLLPQPALNPGSLDLTLNALEENGAGKILASPTLLCRSGKEASFLAGGEIPIKTISFKNQNVVWKQYGVLLKIRPKADFSGRMSIGIETEVSMIDGAHAVDGVPGMLSNRIESHFDLSTPRTIVLSGLIKKEWSEAGKGLPGLSDIPVLGALFGSSDYQDNRSELIVFVTPEVALPDEEPR